MPVEFKDSQCTFEFETTVHRLNSVTLPMIWIDVFCAAVILLTWVPQNTKAIVLHVRHEKACRWNEKGLMLRPAWCHPWFLTFSWYAETKRWFEFSLAEKCFLINHEILFFAFFSDNPIRKSRQSRITEAHWMRGRSRAPALSVISR